MLAAFTCALLVTQCPAIRGHFQAHDAQEWCSEGTLHKNGRYCCGGDCAGQCGGSGCGDRPGGSSKCCSGKTERICEGVADTVCVVDPGQAPRTISPVSFCSKGTLHSNGRYCCGSDCAGQCGGPGCGGLPGGASQCCNGKTTRTCEHAADTICVVDSLQVPRIAPQTSFCSKGTLSTNGKHCCAHNCNGQCGGDGCGTAPGGLDKCCTGTFASVCSTAEDTICIVPEHARQSVASNRPVIAQAQAQAVAIADRVLLNSASDQSAATVSLDSDGETLLYTANARGDTIPDFAHVGYQSDLQPLPTDQNVPALLTVTASTSDEDDTNRIQAAIDAVSAGPINDMTGFRGAVLLGPGEFKVADTVRLHTSGVVLRGSGDGSDYPKNPHPVVTTITATSRRQYTVISVDGPGSTAQGGKPTSYPDKKASILDTYVPVGSFSFNVSHPDLFKKGDLIKVEFVGEQTWMRSIGMDRIPDCTPPLPGRTCTQWTEQNGGVWKFAFERIVEGVTESKVTVDAPLMQGMHKDWGEHIVYKVSDMRNRNMGLEHLRINSEFDPRPMHRGEPADEKHAWTAVHFDGVADAWANRVTCTHLGYACVHIGRQSKHITVESSRSIQPVSRVEGMRRYAFNIDGQLNLVRGCFSDLGRHSYVTGSKVMGPNVFVHSVSTNDLSEIGPHHRWGVGQLYDNIEGGLMAVYDRGKFGSGHGWSGNTIVYFNCLSRCSKLGRSGFHVQSPNGGENYCIGCVNKCRSGVFDSESPACCGTGGSFQSKDVLRTDIPSLYDAQLIMAKRRSISRS